MDATTRTVVEAPASSDFAVLEAAAPAPPPRGRGRRKGSETPANAPIPVTSHLTDQEPVTQAEIDLVLAFLRDSIAGIMGDET